MNSSPNFTVILLVTGYINVTFLPPIRPPLVLYNPLVWIIPYEKDCMIDLCIGLTWKCASSIVLPIVSTESDHHWTCLKQVDNLGVSNIVIRKSWLISICVFHVLLHVLTHTLVPFLALVRHVVFVWHSLVVSQIYCLLYVPPLASSMSSTG